MRFFAFEGIVGMGGFIMFMRLLGIFLIKMVGKVPFPIYCDFSEAENLIGNILIENFTFSL